MAKLRNIPFLINLEMALCVLNVPRTIRDGTCFMSWDLQVGIHINTLGFKTHAFSCLYNLEKPSIPTLVYALLFLLGFFANVSQCFDLVTFKYLHRITIIEPNRNQPCHIFRHRTHGGFPSKYTMFVLNCSIKAQTVLLRSSYGYVFILKTGLICRKVPVYG